MFTEIIDVTDMLFRKIHRVNKMRVFSICNKILIPAHL